MSKEIYHLTQDRLVICDQELGIELHVPFDAPRLSLNLQGAGHVQERDAHGNLRSVFLVSEGRRHGECRLFSEQGQLRSQMYYHHGKLHGPSIMYGDKEEVLATTWYYEGKRIGKARFYYPSGTLSSLQRFKNGEWEGLQEYYYESGSVKSHIPFRLGKLHGEVRLFWESGTLKRSVFYVDGVREGADQLWNEQGILFCEGEYQAGQPFGRHRKYFPDGKLKEECHFHSPVRCDRREWNQEGKLIFEGIFSSDSTYTEKVYLEPQGITVRKGVWDGNRILWK